MTLRQDILDVDPDAKKIALCGKTVFHMQWETPSEVDDRLVVPVTTPRAFLINACNSFSLPLATAVLQFALNAKYKPSRDCSITVLSGFSHADVAFETVVCVPPPTPRQFNSLSESLASATSWILPAFACEFLDGQSGEDFYNAAFNVPRIPVFDWNRSAEPQMRVQLLTDWPGGMYRKLRNPFVDSLSSIIVAVKDIPKNVKLRVLDLWGRELIVYRANREIAYQQNDGNRQSSGRFRIRDAADVLRNFGLGKDVP
jgi:hypothetical protein